MQDKAGYINYAQNEAIISLHYLVVKEIVAFLQGFISFGTTLKIPNFYVKLLVKRSQGIQILRGKQMLAQGTRTPEDVITLISSLVRVEPTISHARPVYTKYSR